VIDHVDLNTRHETQEKISKHTYETNAIMQSAKNKPIILFNKILLSQVPLFLVITVSHNTLYAEEAFMSKTSLIRPDALIELRQTDAGP